MVDILDDKYPCTCSCTYFFVSSCSKLLAFLGKYTQLFSHPLIPCVLCVIACSLTCICFLHLGKVWGPSSNMLLVPPLRAVVTVTSGKCLCCFGYTSLVGVGSWEGGGDNCGSVCCYNTFANGVCTLCVW